MSACDKCDDRDISVFNLTQCNHMVCQRCMCQYLKNFSTCNILCPLKGCKELVPDRIVRKCLNDCQMEKYDRLCLPSIARSCLISGCTGVVAEVEQGGHFECSVCEQPNCLSCNNLHSQNENCGISVNKKKYEDAGATVLVNKRRLKLLQLTKDNSLLRNSVKSECDNCMKFLLPKKGILILPCSHSFCRSCLERSSKTKDVLPGLTCLACDTPLDHIVCKELIGEVELDTLSLNAIQYLHYHCKTPNCTAFWDAGDFKGVHKCVKCHQDNCIGCRAVHKGLTCQQYKQTQQYKDILASEEFERNRSKIICFNCNYSFSKNGGCGAMKCSNCWKQVCAFSGKELGPNGCKCAESKHCDNRCTYGCIPDGYSKYEEELKTYYYNN